MSQAISVGKPARPPRITHDRPPMLAIGVMIWLGSELMFFSGLFAAFFTIRSEHTVWPPPGTHLDTIRAAVFTAVLVSSSFTMQKAVFDEERRDRRSAKIWVGATIVLGLAFLGNQLSEWLFLTTRRAPTPTARSSSS